MYQYTIYVGRYFPEEAIQTVPAGINKGYKEAGRFEEEVSKF